LGHSVVSLQPVESRRWRAWPMNASVTGSTCYRSVQCCEQTVIVQWQIFTVMSNSHRQFRLDKTVLSCRAGVCGVNLLLVISRIILPPPVAIASLVSVCVRVGYKSEFCGIGWTDRADTKASVKFLNQFWYRFKYIAERSLAHTTLPISLNLQCHKSYLLLRIIDLYLYTSTTLFAEDKDDFCLVAFKVQSCFSKGHMTKLLLLRTSVLELHLFMNGL